MFLSDSLAGAVAALVHPGKRADPVQFLRHRIFIGCRLSLSAAAIAGAPLALALRGAPTIGEALAFGWMMFPLAAALYVSRTGDIARGQAIHMTGFIGLCLTLTISGAATAAALWLILVPVEAAFSRHRAAILSAGLIASLAALLMSSTPFNAGPPASVSEIAFFVTPAIFYVMLATLAGRRLQALSHRMAAAGDARYRLLAETIGDLVMRHDRAGAVVFASNGGNDVFHFTTRDVAGRGFFERVHVGDRPAYLNAIAAAAHPGGAVNVRLRVNTGARPSALGDFEEPIFSWAEMRCRHADKSLEFNDGASVVSVVRDITASKLREDELERMRAEAERASLWKDRFLANVSHELRTPLNAIIGFSEMLRDPALAPRETGKQREYAGIIHESGQHLLAMVNSLLDVSKIEAGRFEIAPESFAMAALVDSVADMMRLKAQQGGVTLEAAIDPRVGEIVADKRACRQILINLVSNAVKFTPEGGVVTLRARPEGNSLAIDVIDTGIGIPAPDLPRLGDAFFQARATYDRPHEGTGLGLSLVRGLVGLHGGSIAIESAPGDGTHVCVKLPLDCRHAAPECAPARIETIARRGAVERPGAASMLERGQTDADRAGSARRIA
ncbi:MAG: PAS domain-containing sensor histidine kinase [Methylobacteriaceae bacterium]|nr:PAS domain-containing sensor histidine kinase [Methylobacteriaceae bacterium]